jgi:PAS domain S-box-containing protein
VEELVSIKLAFSGFLAPQVVAVDPVEGQTAAQLSFITPVLDSNNEIRRVLVGHSSLGNNPYSQPILSTLRDPSDDKNIGMLLDEYQNILIHPNPDKVMTTFNGFTSDISPQRGEVMEDGIRMMYYYLPMSGNSWSVVTMVPVYKTQEQAFQIALPLLGMIAFLSLITLVILRFGLGMVTSSLDTLAEEAGRIAQGKLDQPLPAQGVDEVGQLRKAFEQMRISLKARLDELNRLLLVSQGVASSLEVSEAVQPVLEAALVSGASSARVVLEPNIVNDLAGTLSMPLSFGAGPSQNLYRELDEQILALTRQQVRLVLSNLYRPRLLNLTPGAPHPESLLAVALRHEYLYYGALWIAYDKPHNFTEEEVRFIVTLGSQAALASENSRLFLTAEIGRQRLEAILASNPDPVLVTDQREQLLLANPAAWQVIGLSAEETNQGRAISDVIKIPELANLLRATNAEKQSIEVTLPGGRTFLATATPVLAEGQRVGRVCVLRDVTHFKELDDLKSDFVATVSHDLRSPLTLMRGYTTMLEMVGQLNEQQNNYVHKIIDGVESMSRLINNLLDLGRIESGVGLQVEKVNIQEVVEKIVGALQLQATQKNIQLTYELPANLLPPVEADQALLQQALQNLVENAIKYTKADGKVHVRVRLQPNEVLFEVIDNGIGISPIDQPRLFEKFYRGAQQASKEMRGTGLGLAISKSIAEKHGGRIWAESQLGKGSTFYLVIPLRQGTPTTEI